MTLNLETVWADPKYQQSTTRAERAQLILARLGDSNPTRFRAVLQELGLRGIRGIEAAGHLTAAQWQALLGAFGASLVEVSQVLIQLGMTWQ